MPSASSTPTLTPECAHDRSLHAMLRRLAGVQPDRCAVRWLDADASDTPLAPMTYAVMCAQSQATAAWLRDGHGIGAGSRVAWLGWNHPGQLVLLFALAQLGAVLVPLNHRLSHAEWQAVLVDCSPSLLVHDTHLAPAALAIGEATHLPLQPVEAMPTGPIGARHDPCDDQRETPALLVYTSGTTGLPKGAVHTQGNLLANMAIAAQAQAITASDTVLTVLPLFHVGGLCIQTLPALSVGATVLLHARFDPAMALEAIERDQPTLTLQVPATLRAMYEHPRWADTDLSSLRAVWAGSSILPPAALKGFHERGIAVSNVYGSTETGPFSIALPPARALSHAGSCGWPAAGVAVKLLDAQGAVVAIGEVGEICVRAPNVVRCYWPKVPAVDREGFFHTGDLGRQAEDGSISVVGRSKDMIISGGENIYPAEIENALLTHPLVSECAVVPQPDPRWGEVAVAVVVLALERTENDGWEAQLQAHLEDRLARYKQPRHWLAVAALPKTALGKVQKTALMALLAGAPPAA